MLAPVTGVLGVLAASTLPAAPVVGAMTLGVVMMLVGHTVKDNRIVGVGVAVLFVATAALVILGYFAYTGDQVDPRKLHEPFDPSF